MAYWIETYDNELIRWDSIIRIYSATEWMTGDRKKKVISCAIYETTSSQHHLLAITDVSPAEFITILEKEEHGWIITQSALAKEFDYVQKHSGDQAAQ